MRDALLCRLIALALELGTAGVTLALVLLGLLGAVGVAITRWLTSRIAPGSAAPGPPWVAATLGACAVYAFARVLDVLLASRLAPPPGFDPATFARVGWFEWRLFGERRWAWPLLPLDDHPALGIVLHAAFWPIAIVLFRWVLVRLPSRDGERAIDIRYDTPERALPWWYRLTGATTPRRVDDRFRKWIRGLIALLTLLHVTAAGLLATSAGGARTPERANCEDFSIEGAPTGGFDLASLLGGEDAPRADALAAALGDAGVASLVPGGLAGVSDHAAPSPGVWILGGLLLFFLSVHLLTEGRPHAQAAKKEEEGDEEALDDTPPPDPLARLGAALRALRPETRLEALDALPPVAERTAPIPERLGLIARELLEELTGRDRLYAHQREVLDHLLASWQLDAAAGSGPTPTLVEEVSRSPVRRADATPHALVLAPEGSGRTTLARLALLHIAYDRGATTLVVLPTAGAARRWAEELRAALDRSSARWTLHVCLAGDDLQATLLGGKTPNVVVADLESFESEVLGDPRSDVLLDRLGLVVVDDADAFVGVAEMHLHLCMRRLWALADTRRRVEDAPYPLVLLAIAGPAPGASGVEPWARHLLAAPLRVFEGDGAPRVARALLRRRDLVDASGEDVPLAVLAEACDAAGLTWHARFCGDRLRELRRVDGDLARFRRHHVDDPREAEVVLLEGNYPNVRREAERLAHAGVVSEAGTAVIVLAPPAEEEMVLHEEAEDAPRAALVRGMPRSVVLAEPDLLRQRHFDRALGREHDVDALRARFGAGFVDETIERLDASGRVARRTVWRFDRRRDDAVATERLRAVREAALGEPIRRDCVSDAAATLPLLDAGTSEEIGVVDRAVAPALHPPGSVLLGASGRYLVRREVDRTIHVEPLAEAWRTTIDRTTTIDGARPAFTERQLGGEPCRLALVRAEVRERIVGLRRLGPGAELIEQRRLEPPVEARYATDVLLVAPPANVEDAALLPLAAALRMMAGPALRGAEHLLGVDVVTIGGARCLAFWDRTPGASGYASALASDQLSDLLQLARLVLERLVGREWIRLRRLHDTTPTEGHDADAPAARWDVAAALTWLDALLDPTHDASAPRVPKVVYVPGEGSAGDLGRVWIARSGRTDDLVWTRHAFVREGTSSHLDVAVERRAILATLDAHGPRVPVHVRRADEWRAVHEPLTKRPGFEIDALAELVREGRAGAPDGEATLAMVAAIPTRSAALSIGERAPLVALARRRADVDAKVLLAFVLLPPSAEPAVLVDEDGVLLRAFGRVWDLGGRLPREVEPRGEPALG
ncbi:MAG: DEAD/DEAH box helicase [Myxococcales bacterium]|nr:DEAD/DEAH box helicase [Myxococcales bacterium]